MNNKIDVNEKIISLYKFISEFCKVKHKIITNDKDFFNFLLIMNKI